jgi:hypothetical protein
VAKSNPLTQLAERIQGLIEARQHHASAIEAIDQTLAGVGAALGTKKVGRPKSLHTAAPMMAAPAMAVPAAAEGGKKRRRRRRSKYAMSAEDSILGFVKENRNPTTQEIKAHYASENRGGSADNVLSKLFREKRIKRAPIGPGIRGSRYSVP